MDQIPLHREAATEGTLLRSSSSSATKEAIVVNYMLSVESGLDGTTHPALNTQNPTLAYDKQSKTFAAAEEILKIDQYAQPTQFQTLRPCSPIQC